MTPLNRAWLRLFALVVGTAMLVGCGSSSTPKGDGPTPQVTAGARDESIPTAHPTPVPDPAAELAEYLRKASDQIEATFEGTMMLGEEEVPVSGAYASSRRHFHTTIEYAGASLTGTAEQIYHGGANFVRSDGGSWMRTDDPPDLGMLGVPRLLAGASALRSLGDAEGTPGYARFEPVGLDMELLLRRLGLLDRNGELASGAARLLTDRDGDLVGMAIEAVTTLSAADVTVMTRWDLEFSISSIGKPVRIEPPTDAWRIRTDAEFGYVILYPHDWEFSEETEGGIAFHLFLAPDDGEMQIYQYTEMAGTTAEGWFAESAQLLEHQFGSRPQEASLTIGSRPARLYTLEVVEHGRRLAFQQAVVYGDQVAWDINWWSLAGDEETDGELFARVLATFVPLR